MVNLKGKLLFTFSIVSIFSVLVMGAEEKNRSKSEALTIGTPSTKFIMRDVFNSFVGLVPYMSSEMKFTDPSNEEDITKRLTKMNLAFSWAHNSKTFKNPKFSTQVQVMRDHLGGALSSFISKNKHFSLNRLRTTANLCISCHSQFPSSKRINMSGLTDSWNRKKFGNDLEFANFLMILRKYDLALHYLELEMNTFVTTKKELLKLDSKMVWDDRRFQKSLERILVIYTKVKNNPRKAKLFLQKWQRIKSLSKVRRKLISSWIKDLEKMDPKLSDMNVVELQKYLSLRDKNNDFSKTKLDLGLLIATGKISRYFEKKSNKLVAPEYLYWMSKGEQQLTGAVFYSLSEIHLKDCIEGYPKSDWAKKCFAEYENLIVGGFTGSSGTNIPKVERDELKRLKSLIK